MKYHGSKKWLLYEDFTDWLLGLRDELPDETWKVITHQQLISLFSRVPELFKFSNKYLNNYSTYGIPVKELAQFIKYLVGKHGIQRKQIWWFANLDFQDPTSHLQKLSLLKRSEKQYIMTIKPSYRPHEKPEKKKSSKVNRAESTQNNEIKNFDLESTASSEEQNNFLDKFSKDHENCKHCPLYNRPQVLFDYNKEIDVDILFVFEAPGAVEVEKGIPAIGKSGQLFRRFLNEYIESNNISWFITNTCLCRPDNNQTPGKVAVQACSPFLEEVIKHTNPKLIVAAGSTAKNRFKIKANGILNVRGFYSYIDGQGITRKVFLTVHPSYIARGNSDNYFHEDFSSIVEYFRNLNNDSPTVHAHEFTDEDDDLKDSISSPEITKVNGAWTIKQKDYIYDSDLVNIEYIRSQNLVVYTLRNNRKKQYFRVPATFYYFAKKGWGPAVIDNSKVHILEGKPTYSHPENTTLYESDMSIDMRHSIDYYYVLHSKNKKNNYKPNVMYIDIEVFSETGEFIEPSKATAPVTLVSVLKETPYENYIRCYVNGQRINHNIKNAEVIFCNSERELLQNFAAETTQNDIDIVTAWNISYDYPYIYNRMRKTHVDPRLLSPLHSYPSIDAEKFRVRIPGLITPDLLQYYKIMTYGNRDSYALDYICQLELGTGKTEGHGDSFYLMWQNDKEKSIRYNIDDVILTQKLNEKMQIMEFFNTIRKISACNWQDITMMSKKVDSMLMLYAKQHE